MDDTAASVPRCQERQSKSKSARFPSLLVTLCPVSGQPAMPRNATCRRVAMFLRTYAIALSFNVLSIYLHMSLHNGALLAEASSVLPAKQGHAKNPATGALSPFPTAHGPYRVPSQPDATASEAANTVGVEKQSVSELKDGTETVEAPPSGKQPLRLLASASAAAPWSVLGTVLPAYLVMLEQKLLVALKNLSPVRWEAVSTTAEHVDPRFPALGLHIGEHVEEGGVFDSRVYPLLTVPGTLPASQESVRLPGGMLDDPVQNAAQLWQDFFALAQARGYAGAVPPLAEKKVQQISSAPVQGRGGVVPSDRLPVDGVKKTVQQVLNDIRTLASVQQLVSDFAGRLNYSLRAEQALRERISCLAAYDAQSDKRVERRGTRNQPGADCCAGVEKLQKEERLALRLASEKLLNGVQRAARDAAQLLFSILSTPELDGPFERYNILPLYEQMSPLLTIALRLLERLQDLQYVAAPANPQAAELVSEKEASQAMSPHLSRSQPDTAGSPGLAPRSLASVPTLRGHTLFSKELQPRPSCAQVSFAPPPRRSSAPTYYAPRLAYQCIKRPAEGHASVDVLTCECRHPTEAVQEATFLEPVICSRVRRATSHRAYLPAVEQTLECYPSVHETSYIQSPPQPLPRASVEYAAVSTRSPLPAADPPLQCHCYKPRAQYECRRPPQRFVQRESVRVIPEVVEHRVVEPVVTPLECELVPRSELYVPPPVPVPETVLVPCECVEQSVPVPGGYMPKHDTEVYSAGHHESVLIPLECILRSPQPERVPCECFARPVAPESLAYIRPPVEYAPYVECMCVRDEHQLSSSAYPGQAYHYEFAE